jgi:hypothetical protein
LFNSLEFARTPDPSREDSCFGLAGDETKPVKESERDELRKRVDEAKRGEVEKDRLSDRERRARSPGEIKRQADERKAIFAAQTAHDTDLDQLAVVAHRGDVYLVSVGAGRGRILDLSGQSPSFSPPTEIYALTAGDAEWLPFNGDADEVLAVAARLILADA